MPNENVFNGTREEWLNSTVYTASDIYNDNFALDFRIITIEERIKMGEIIEEPEFVEDYEKPF